MLIRVKRVYEPRHAADGVRILVDRLWPRGLSKAKADIDAWFPKAAPSSELRKWFGHDARRWPEFKTRYFAELTDLNAALTPIYQYAMNGPVTLLHAARDVEMNNAIALREYLSRPSSTQTNTDEPGNKVFHEKTGNCRRIK